MTGSQVAGLHAALSSLQFLRYNRNLQDCNSDVTAAFRDAGEFTLRTNDLPPAPLRWNYSFGSTIPFCAWYFPLRSR